MKKNPKKRSAPKVNKGKGTFNHWMRNPTPSSGQNSQLVCWWVLVHAGRENQLTSCCLVPNQSLSSSFLLKSAKRWHSFMKKEHSVANSFFFKKHSRKTGRKLFSGGGCHHIYFDITVVSRLSTHSFKYASQLSTHFLAKNLGFKIY
jgi:hypothetical protein